MGMLLFFLAFSCFRLINYLSLLTISSKHFLLEEVIIGGWGNVPNQTSNLCTVPVTLVVTEGADLTASPTFELILVTAAVIPS